MRDIDTLAEHLARYLKSDTATQLAAWDEQIRATQSKQIEVFCVLGWRDVTRAVSATQIIDREMRRGARACRDAYGSASGADGLFSSPAWLLDHLARFPQPLHTSQSGLEIITVTGPPLALHLMPTEASNDALAHSAASLVGSTMAAFGKPFSIQWLSGRNRGSSDLDLAAVVEFVSDGRTPLEVTNEHGLRAEDLRRTYYQAVSSPARGEHLGFEVHLVVQRVCTTHVDLVHAWY